MCVLPSIGGEWEVVERCNKSFPDWREKAEDIYTKTSCAKNTRHTLYWLMPMVASCTHTLSNIILVVRCSAVDRLRRDYPPCTSSAVQVPLFWSTDIYEKERKRWNIERTECAQRHTHRYAIVAKPHIRCHVVERPPHLQDGPLDTRQKCVPKPYKKHTLRYSLSFFLNF